MKTAIVGYARSAISMPKLRENISRHIRLKDDDEKELFEQFLAHNVYSQGKYDDPEDFKRLTKIVEKLEHDDQGVHANNRLFYLALPPSVFEPVTKLIHDHCMSKR